MKLEGSAIIQIECSKCLAKSNKFRVYVYEDDEGHLWGGKLPEGWTTVGEAEIIRNDNANLPGIVIGGCPEHLCSE